MELPLHHHPFIKYSNIRGSIADSIRQTCGNVWFVKLNIRLRIFEYLCLNKPKCYSLLFRSSSVVSPSITPSSSLTHLNRLNFRLSTSGQIFSFVQDSNQLHPQSNSDVCGTLVDGDNCLFTGTTRSKTTDKRCPPNIAWCEVR
jgi:hypothetical protein